MLSQRIGFLALCKGLSVSIVCLFGAISVAGAPCVSPDEEACLPAVVVLTMNPDDHEFGFVQDAGIGPDECDSFEGDPSDPSSENSCIAAAWSELSVEQMFAPRGLPPVVRGQSPEIQLLGLADDAVSIEKTSLLSSLTGTKGRLRGDYLTDFDQTERIGVQWLTQGWLGLGLDTEANYWQRPVRDLGQETLWTGDLNLIYNLIPHPRFKLRSGLGAAWAIDQGKPHAGYNITHGLDVYLLWRVMATGEIDWGAIDGDKLFRYRLALGLTYGSAEFYTGYESLRLGSERLDGWVNGVAIWY